MFPNSFCEVSINLIPKPDKDNTRKKKKKKHILRSPMKVDAKSSKKTCNANPKKYIKQIIHYEQVRFTHYVRLIQHQKNQLM